MIGDWFQSVVQGHAHFFPEGADRPMCGLDHAAVYPSSHEFACKHCMRGLRARERDDAPVPEPEPKPPALIPARRCYSERKRYFEYKGAAAIDRFLYPERVERPKTRADCVDGPRPCPYVGCRYNMFLDVTPGGTVRFYWNEPWEVPPHQSCALDLAERGGMVLEDLGAVLGITRERARQVELIAFEELVRKMK